MARTAVSHATPSVVAWARRASGYTVEDVAEWLKVPPARLVAWESGEESPSIAQLKKLASRYRRPLAVFYLPEPPKDFAVPHDYRSLPGGPPKTSPAILWELRRASEHREAALELLAELEEQVPTFSALGKVPSDPEQLGGLLRRRLGVTDEEQASWRQPYDALREWREKVEATGVMVVQVSRIDDEERLSGACLHHSVLPVILLNRANTVRRRIFTLLHEYAHLLTGTGGVCDTHDGDLTDREVFCNAVAAAALMPKDAFLAHPAVKAKGEGSVDWSDEDLDVLAKRFTTSRESALRRALTFGKTTPGHYNARKRHMDRIYAEQRERERREQAAKEAKGMNQSPFIMGRNGYMFTRWALEAYDRRLINTNELSGYLDAKVRWIPEVRRLAGLA